jgi:hypothetical protein
MGFVTVVFVMGSDSVISRVDWYYIGLSTLIGLAGKEADGLVRLFVRRFFGVAYEDHDDEERREDEDAC